MKDVDFVTKTATWGTNEAVVSKLTELLVNSWAAYENYTAPLGVGFICNGNHYEPDPPHRVSYTNASKSNVGFHRGGANLYGGTYNPRVAVQFDSVDTTPEELLLCFHNVPYTHKLSSNYSGLSVLEYIYSSHKAGAATAASYIETWQSLKSDLDTTTYGDGVFDAMTKRLTFGASEAKRFEAIIVDYFANLTNIPPPP